MGYCTRTERSTKARISRFYEESVGCMLKQLHSNHLSRNYRRLRRIFEPSFSPSATIQGSYVQLIENTIAKEEYDFCTIKEWAMLAK
mmetsp:Transcript_9838/g.15107  ORF Transcript_9838/g.15107 Transcript_9838/m.15107 type:complete len:87 (+) Transcript_9838:354-614(+)